MYRIILLASFCLFLNLLANTQRLNPYFGKNGIATVTSGQKLNTLSETIFKIFPLSDGKTLIVIDANNYAILSRRFADGSVDKTYGDSGYSQPVKIMQPLAAAMQDDGKIVVTGQSDFNNTDFILARFNTDGTSDKLFGTNGVQMTDFGSPTDNSNTLAIDHSGKIVVGGTTVFNGNTCFALARYNNNGSLDLTFNGNGKVVTDLGSFSVLQSLAIQSDNKIVAGGLSGQNGTVIRYTTEGKIDSSYGYNGLANPLSSFSIKKIVFQNDGKLVLGGDSFFSYLSNFEIVRLNPDGNIDYTFNGTGNVITDFGSQQNFLFDLSIDNSGIITAVGVADNGPEQDYAISRYNQDGSYDITFKGTGMATIDGGWQYEAANSVAIQDNKILAGGYGYVGNGYDFTMVRLTLDGNYDPTFASSGKLDDFIPAFSTGPNDFIRLTNGKLLMSGSYPVSMVPYQSQNFIKQYTANGSEDLSFGNKGLVKVNGMYLANLLNGNIIVAGSKTINQQSDLYIETFLPNGNPDISFGTNGSVSTDFGGDDFPIGIQVQQDGKFVVSGFYYSNSGADIWLARYNTNGTLDVTFGQNGKVITDINNSDDYPNSIALQKDGKIIIAGYFWSNNEGHIFLTRYNTNGTLDPSFGTLGKAIFNFSQLDNTNTIVPEPDGTILFSGASFPDWSSPYVPFLMHLKSNGTLDSSFGQNGKIYMEAAAIAIQKNKKILVGGRNYIQNISGIELTRLNSNGSIDQTFGTNGVLKTKVTTGEDILAKMKLNNSNLYVLGYSLTPEITSFIASYILDNEDDNRDNGKSNSFIVHISPNPSNSEFQLQLDNIQYNDKITFSVIDNSGRIVEIRYVNPGETISFGKNYVSGMYVVEVLNGDQKQVVKIIKN